MDPRHAVVPTSGVTRGDVGGGGYRRVSVRAERHAATSLACFRPRPWMRWPYARASG